MTFNMENTADFNILYDQNIDTPKPQNPSDMISSMVKVPL